MLRAGWVVVMLVAACVQDQLVPCGDVACPTGDVCTPGGCATPDNAAACDGMPDHTPCASTTITNGACGGGRCHDIVCGDGIVDPGEVCDDANTTPGDGCAATCDSDESCGNGVIDLFVGEECDDQNLRSSDGCSSTCSLERPAWRDITPVAILGRSRHTMAYDAALGRVILFGGATVDEIVDETWALEDGQWVRLAPAASPPARINAAMSYDPVRERMVLFGGGGSALRADTWEFDGVTWVERHPAHAPSPRMQAAMAYSPELGKIVLYGGNAGNATALGDMWTWDGTDWQELTPPVTPGPTYNAVMAYDSARHRLVLYGAEPSANQTWEHDGTTWIHRTPATTPRFSIMMTMAYDARNQRTLVLGSGGLWAWSGTDWAEVTAPGLEPLLMSALAYDAIQQQVVQFGGITTCLCAPPSSTTWTWDGTTWTSTLPVAANPPGRSEAAVAYDTRRGNLVMFGGRGGTTYADTWLWDLRGWHQASPAQSPSLREFTSATYDIARGQVILFGGRSTALAPLGDTWAWNGVTWGPLAPAASPSPRYDIHLAYDAARERVVLFGGRDAANQVLDDTWEWDGTTWIQRTPAASPPARSGAHLAYDPIRQRIVLFGGSQADYTPLTDTWEWDGSTWSARISSSAVLSGDGQLAFDPQRGRMLLLGGPGGVLDVREWDGTTWTRLDIVPPSPSRRYATFAYDPVGHQLLRFSGLNYAGSVVEDMYALRWESATRAERCLIATTDDDGDQLAGCDDPDCWARCAPLCPPQTSCSSGTPRCGDATCDATEDAFLCPSDCP